MTDKEKEFYIKKVEKHNKDLSSAKLKIAVGTAVIALGAVYVLMNIFGINSENPLVKYALHAGMSFASLGGLIALISGIAEKSGTKASINKIEELFQQHGLVLEDEISKGRSK